MSSYSSLSRAQLSFEYLHSNSTTHEFLFGALAELIDNSRDANATKIDIFSVKNDDIRGGYMLCFLDDGCGMDRDESHNVIMFGKSSKKALDATMIGQYGNGLKSGAMRAAKDFLVFSKKGNILTCIYLSRTFHEDEKITEVIVPIPSWNLDTKTPYPSTPEALNRHELEIKIIQKHSPFKSEQELLAQFERIETKSGTLVMLLNMKLLDNSEPELDVTTDPTDILMGSEKTTLDSEGLVLERRSLRAYTCILYLEPRMRIYVQGVKVQTRRLANCLYKPKMFKYTSSRFKTRAEAEARRCKDEHAIAEERAREAESNARDLEKRLGSSTDKNNRSKVRVAQQDAEDKRREADMMKKVYEKKEKSAKEPKTLSFIFGFNIENRTCDGMFMYNCGRLIKMYERTGPQIEGGVNCSGVVGIVDVPYIVLQPAHNKQDFADGKEYRHLLKVMGEHLVDYWTDSDIMRKGVSQFWEEFGYESEKWSDPCSDSLKFVRKRCMHIPTVIQCNLCLKWRVLPFVASNIGKKYPSDWVCTMNLNAQYNRCNAPEQKFTFPILDRKKPSRDKVVEERPPAPPPKMPTLPSFGRTILERPAVLPEPKIFKPISVFPETFTAKPNNIVKKPISRQATPVRNELPSREVRKRPASPVVSKPAFNEVKPRKEKRLKSPSPEPPPHERRQSKPKKEPPPPPPVVSKKQKSVPQKSLPTTKPPIRRDNAPAEVKKRPPISSPDSSVEKRSSLRSKPIPKMVESSSEDEEPSTTSNEYKAGTLVEAKLDGVWLRGRTAEVNRSSKRIKVRFDRRNTADKWYLMSSQDVRPFKTDDDQPSTTTEDAGKLQPNNEHLEVIVQNYRSCLKYFQPPSWHMTSDTMSSLTPEELSKFPLQQFFEQYEKGLRKLIIEQKKMEVSKKIENMRHLAVQLLRKTDSSLDIKDDIDVESLENRIKEFIQRTT